MCFAQPVAQEDPARPAGYSLADSYKQVTTSTMDEDGKVVVGARKGQYPAVNPDPAWPGNEKTTSKVGATPIKM